MAARFIFGRMSYRSSTNSGSSPFGSLSMGEAGAYILPHISQDTPFLFNGYELGFEGALTLALSEFSEEGSDSAPTSEQSFSESDALAEEPASGAPWPYVEFDLGQGTYTLIYCIVEVPEDSESDTQEGGGRNSARSSGPQRASLEIDLLNGVRPRETMLIFAPKYSRKYLKKSVPILSDDGEVQYRRATKKERQQRHVDRIAKTRQTRIWTGADHDTYVRRGNYPRPYKFNSDQTLNVGGERRFISARQLYVAEKADAGEFQGGMQRFGDYWGVPQENRFEIDNGLNTAPQHRLGGSHPGLGDAKPQNERREEVESHLDAYYDAMMRKEKAPLSAIVFFCHGWSTGFQLGFQGRPRIVRGMPRNLRQTRPGTRDGQPTPEFEQFVEKIKRISREDLVVVMYACSTAKAPQDQPDNSASFAGRFRDLLISGENACPACRVVGHSVAGHAFRTPFNVFFDGQDGAGTTGTVVAPGAAGRETTLRYKFKQYLKRTPPEQHSGFVWEFPFLPISAIQSFLNEDTHTPGLFDEGSGAYSAPTEEEEDTDYENAEEEVEEEEADEDIDVPD